MNFKVGSIFYSVSGSFRHGRMKHIGIENNKNNDSDSDPDTAPTGRRSVAGGGNPRNGKHPQNKRPKVGAVKIDYDNDSAGQQNGRFGRLT
jgi:hypothetical protein